MMIRILQAREAQKKKLQKADNVPVKNKVPPGKNHEDDHQDLRTKEDLFPNYPWKYDSEAIFPHKVFKADVPAKWRLYKKGSEWLFGLHSFIPLHFYWSQLTWTDYDPHLPSVTWLELALDFHAATHCALAMPGHCQESQTAAQCARFFMQASKRMSSICKCRIFPGDTFSHAPALTALGLVRANGLHQRPKLLCPCFVHNCLFLTATSAQRTLNNSMNFRLVLPAYEKPLWIPAEKRRLTGKQQPPHSASEQPVRRNVESHKPKVAGVTWTEDEHSILATASEWRHRQQLEKILLRNRDALQNAKHLINHERSQSKFSCTRCKKTNTNLSKLIKDGCGGVTDANSYTHHPRASVQLKKRTQLVSDHNERRDFHHQIVSPTAVDSPVQCHLCGATENEGWRRFIRFAKQTCPLSTYNVHPYRDVLSNYLQL